MFVEPAAVVEINNELRIAHQEEHREIERILREFSSEVVPHVEELKLTLETLAELDLIFAKGKYSCKIQAQPLNSIKMDMLISSRAGIRCSPALWYRLIFGLATKPLFW